MYEVGVSISKNDFRLRSELSGQRRQKAKRFPSSVVTDRLGSQEKSFSTLTWKLKERGMLVLTRKLGESIAIDDHIKIRVVQIKGKQVRLGIEAPKDTKIHREEVYMAIQSQNTESAQATSEAARGVAKLLKP
jgi:carbon storage regulator